MSSNRRKKLAAVRRYASRLEDNAAAHLATVANDVQAAKQLLQELIEYRKEYLTPPATREQWQAQHWEDYYGFLRRLDRAVDAQREIAEQHGLRLRSVREEWQRLRTRNESLDHMDQQLLNTEQQRSELIAQKEADAWALMARIRQAQ
ncbi:MAG: flagellar FliJ family protein [Pseudomonadota bacterium]